MRLEPCLRLVAGGALLSLLGGCGALLEKPAPAPAVVEAQPPRESSPAAPLLELMAALPQGDPARQAELLEQARQGAVAQPTPGNRLTLALVLATPGHGGYDPVAAQRQLAELLATPETLVPVERLLAQVELREVNQRLIMLAENKQLRDDETQESRDKLLAANRRLATESDENARLRKALDEERAKLDAVTHIERSINDRATNGPHNP